MGGRTSYPQQNPQFNPQRQQYPLPQFSPHTHFNPAFLAQQQQPYPNSYFNPIYTTPQPQQQWQPPPQNNPYLSYSQEQYQSQNRQAQLPSKPQPQPQPQPQQHKILPPSESYVAAQSGWPSQQSYGHFTPPTQPARKQHRKDDKPDMDEETWLSLNGGKLLGTNIAPPETPEEIEAWIAQRKARFPTAKKIAEKEAIEKSKKEQQKVPDSRKRKRDGEPLVGSDVDNDYDTNASDSGNDAPPEAVSSKARPVIHDVHRPEAKKRLAAVCRNFAQRGRCPRGDGCKFRHERKEKGAQARREGKKEGEGRKTLYQRLVENDREKENTLMLQVIQYLIDKGKLHEEKPQGEQGQN